MAGGRMVSADVLFLQVWPTLSLHGFTGKYGECHVEGIPTRTGELVMQLGGSMSTFMASIAGLALLCIQRWGPFMRAALLSVGLWWVDLLTYTLPTWGIRRSVLWGGRYSEPYEAAVALGVPGPVFQLLVVLTSLILAWAWVGAFRRGRSSAPAGVPVDLHS